MKYVFIRDTIVAEIIPAIDSAFPSIPIEQRYTAEFITSLIPVDESVEVEQNWIYEDGKFVAPPEPEDPETSEE